MRNVLFLSLLVAFGCSDDAKSPANTPQNDGGNTSDVAADSAGDVGNNSVGDMARDVTTEEDAQVDAQFDVGVDLTEDAASDLGDMLNLNSAPNAPGPFEFSISADPVPTTAGDVNADFYEPTVETNGPVVLFFPGFRLGASRYAGLGEYLASHGMTVAMVDPDMPLFGLSHVKLANDAGTVATFLRTQYPGRDIVVAGHSLGGKVMAMAAETIGAGAYVGIDPVNGESPFSGYTNDIPDARPIFDDFLGPKALIGELTDASGAIMNCAPEDQNYQTLYDAANGSTLEWTYPTADHMDFVWDTSQCFECGACQSGAADEGAVQAATATFVTAFIQEHILGFDRTEFLSGAQVPNAVSVRQKN